MAVETPTPTDGGYSSRKLLFSVMVVALIFAGWYLGAKLPALSTTYQVMVGGLLGVTAIYLGGNIGAKWVLSKQIKQEPETEDDPDESC